jgi:hypothetical protein
MENQNNMGKGKMETDSERQVREAGERLQASFKATAETYAPLLFGISDEKKFKEVLSKIIEMESYHHTLGGEDWPTGIHFSAENRINEIEKELGLPHTDFHAGEYDFPDSISED